MARGFYGWRIVAVAFGADFIAVGFLFYSFGIFLPWVEKDLEASRGEISLALGIANATGALAAPLLGRAVDRFPIRNVMTAGALAMAAGFALLSRVDALWQVYALFGTAVGVGAMAMGNLSTGKLVANWFERRRGTALGVATMGISLSGLVMPSVATWLILNLGWRGGFLTYAAGTLLLVLPPVWAVVVSRPEDRGLRPDGEPPPEADGAEGAAAPETAWRSRDVLRAPGFWAIALPFAIAFFATSAVLTHAAPHALALGVPEYRAAWALSCMAGAGVAGKVTFGRVADRLGTRTALTLSLGLQAAGAAALVGVEQYALLLPTALVFGFGMGGLVPLQSGMLAEAFGRLSFGKAMGLLRPVQIPLHAAGVPFAGWVYSTTGGYAAAFGVFVGAYLLAMGVVNAPALAGRRAALAAADEEPRA